MQCQVVLEMLLGPDLGLFSLKIVSSHVMSIAFGDIKCRRLRNDWRPLKGTPTTIVLNQLLLSENLRSMRHLHEFFFLLKLSNSFFSNPIELKEIIVAYHFAILLKMLSTEVSRLLRGQY